MPIIVGDFLIVDKDSISPDSIAATTEVLTHRLLDKAASKGWALDWTTTKVRVETEGHRLRSCEARVVVEAEKLR